MTQQKTSFPSHSFTSTLPGSAANTGHDLVVSPRLDDLAFPGVVVELSPEEADSEGLSVEDAVSFEDAYEANADTDNEE
jgi:hypothetical protein